MARVDQIQRMDGKVNGQNVVLLEEGLRQPRTEHGAVVYDDSNLRWLCGGPVDRLPFAYNLAYDGLQEVHNVLYVSFMQAKSPSINLMEENTRILHCQNEKSLLVVVEGVIKRGFRLLVPEASEGHKLNGDCRNFIVFRPGQASLGK